MNMRRYARTYAYLDLGHHNRKDYKVSLDHRVFYLAATHGSMSSLVTSQVRQPKSCACEKKGNPLPRKLTQASSEGGEPSSLLPHYHCYISTPHLIFQYWQQA